MLSLAAAAVLIFAAGSAVVRAQAAKIDITGTWTFEVVTAAGPGTPTVTLKQDGEKVTGHYSSQTLGEADLTGTIKGQDLTFSFTADLGGQSAPVEYKATVENSSSMKGTIDVAGGLASGTFTGKKK
jgi:hypothetical protein